VIRWTPGHDSIPGNERADEEAKKAEYGDSSPAPLLPKVCRDPVLVSRSAECQEWESREGGLHQGKSQIALGAWENTQRDQDGSNTKKQ